MLRMLRTRVSSLKLHNFVNTRHFYKTKRLAEMLASRPGLGLKTVQDHFLEVLVLVLRYLVLVLVLECLVLVLVLNGGLWSRPRPCFIANM